MENLEMNTLASLFFYVILQPEEGTLVLWISRSILDLDLLLIYRLI